MILFDAIRLILSDLSKPDDFRHDWYGWVTNQLAHITVGIILTIVFSALNFILLGEFAQKIVLWGMVFVTYAIIEIYWQKKNRTWDTIEDFVFVVGYGAGTPILMFDEARPGSPEMVSEIVDLVPVCVIVTTHIVSGALSRAVEEVKNGAK